VIEIDGSSHENKVDYDRKREDYLRTFGLRIYRITTKEILNNMNSVIIKLEAYILKHYRE
jgi:very-short-patch-repair endonuclease